MACVHETAKGLTVGFTKMLTMSTSFSFRALCCVEMGLVGVPGSVSQAVKQAGSQATRHARQKKDWAHEILPHPALHHFG